VLTLLVVEGAGGKQSTDAAKSYKPVTFRPTSAPASQQSARTVTQQTTSSSTFSSDSLPTEPTTNGMDCWLILPTTVCVCVCVCVRIITFELSDFWSRCLAGWLNLTLVVFEGQGHRSEIAIIGGNTISMLWGNTAYCRAMFLSVFGLSKYACSTPVNTARQHEPCSRVLPVYTLPVFTVLRTRVSKMTAVLNTRGHSRPVNTGSVYRPWARK